MPRKTQKTENGDAISPGGEKKASKQEKATPKPRTRTVQPKKEDLARIEPVTEPVAPKPARKRTSNAGSSAAKAKEPKPDVQASAVKEEPKPVLPAPLPAALPTQVNEPKDVITAVPPVAFPTLQGERRSFLRRVLMLLAVGALLALSVLILFHRPTQYSAYSHSILFLYDDVSGTTQVLYDGKPCEVSASGKLSRSERDSSGSVCAALFGDALYLVRGDEVTQVATSVSDFALSQNGRTLCYRTADEKLFCAKTGRDLKVSTVSSDVQDARYCLSPDGEFLFYTYVKKESATTHADVFSLSGEKPFLPHTTGMIPVAIADDYEHLFYFNDAGDLYYMNGEGKPSLCRRKSESEMALLFDREFEELIVTDADGMTLWREGKAVVLSQIKGAEYLTPLVNHRAVARTLPCAAQYLVQSFDESYYLKLGTEEQGKELVYLQGDALHTVAFVDRFGSNPVVTDKGVFYLGRVTMENEERKQLFHCPLGQKEPRVLAFDVEDFKVNSDGSRLLYVDHRSALYAARVVGDALDATRICDEVRGVTLCVSGSDAFYYMSTVGALYVSDNGKEPTSVSVQGTPRVDVHTAFFAVPSVPVSDGDTVEVTYTLYSNHRNRRECRKVATGISESSLLEFLAQLAE